MKIASPLCLTFGLFAALRRCATLAAAFELALVAAQPVRLETDDLVLSVDRRGWLVALTDRASGTNYLAAGQPAPLLQVRTEAGFSMPESMAWDGASGRITLRYEGIGMSAVVQTACRPTHVVFELVDLAPGDRADLVLWGPYPTTIGAVVGETVGVVRNPRFALGIQALNIKTLGGFPNSEDDVMPMYDLFAGADFSDIAAEHRDKDLFRGDTAKPTAFGSVLQAFCRDRRRERVIANWGHTHYVAPPYEDGGVIGSRIGLFGCPTADALVTLERIELDEGLPHPVIDGVWGKISPVASASYLIVDFGEESLDQALELTRRAGLRYLYHGGPFRTWGHFELHTNQFPEGWRSMKRCVERARTQGIRLGVHTLSNFITPNDPYVTPVPDARLARVGTSALTGSIGAEDKEIGIEDPVWFNQMKNNTLKTVVTGEELIRYGGVSTNAPWRLLDCQRGAWGTRAAAHAAGERIGKLMDHGYRVFLTDAALSREVAERLADLFNEAGLLQVSFDGLEGNWSTAMGQYGRTLFTKAWFDRLSPELRGRVINDASNPGHFTWHIYTRMNWGEPWYAGFRESQTQYRLKNQRYYARNLMPRMLGWFQMNAETNLEDAEWLLARAAGFDAGFCLVTSPGTVRQNGQGETILEAIKEWEKARLAGAFREDMKAGLQDIAREFQLAACGAKDWELTPVHSVKMAHARREQPGQPTSTSGTFDNPHAGQPLQFIVQASGKAEAAGVVIEIDGTEALALAEPLAVGRILRYTGGDSAILYDRHWQRLGTIAVAADRLRVPAGKSTIRIECRFGAGEEPRLKCEWRTLGAPTRVIGVTSLHSTFGS